MAERPRRLNAFRRKETKSSERASAQGSRVPSHPCQGSELSFTRAEGGGEFPPRASTSRVPRASRQRDSFSLSVDERMTRLYAAHAGADEVTDYATVYETYSKAIFRLAFLLVGGNKTLADDVVSDVFERVYRKWRQGRITDVGAYLRQATRNRVKELFGRGSLEREKLVQYGQDNGSVPAPEDHSADASVLAAALASLPLGQRTAVVLYYYEDRSYADIARILGNKSIGTVKKQISLGVGRLRAELEPQRVSW
jgi:RNA polymerase sigma factor (sigma-70 family)